MEVTVNRIQETATTNSKRTMVTKSSACPWIGMLAEQAGPVMVPQSLGLNGAAQGKVLLVQRDPTMAGTRNEAPRRTQAQSLLGRLKQ